MTGFPTLSYIISILLRHSGIRIYSQNKAVINIYVAATSFFNLFILHPFILPKTTMEYLLEHLQNSANWNWTPIFRNQRKLPTVSLLTMKSAHLLLTEDLMRLHALPSISIFLSHPQLFSLHRRFLLLGISVPKSLAITHPVKIKLDPESNF